MPNASTFCARSSTFASFHARAKLVVRFDHLYIGGGNAKDLTFSLPKDVSIVPNTDGLTGGIRLWHKDATPNTPGSGAGSDTPAGPVQSADTSG